MHYLARTSVDSSSELGSLEDLNPEKRITVSQIRTMRLQALKQEKWGFSILRALAKVWGEIRTFVSETWSQKSRERHCELNGHSPARIGEYGSIPRCRYCSAEIYQPRQNEVSEPY